MISPQLQGMMKCLEMAAFPIWQKANPVQRKVITKKLGEIEACLIIKEIEKESKKQHGK